MRPRLPLRLDQPLPEVPGARDGGLVRPATWASLRRGLREVSLCSRKGGQGGRYHTLCPGHMSTQRRYLPPARGSLCPGMKPQDAMSLQVIGSPWRGAPLPSLAPSPFPGRLCPIITLSYPPVKMSLPEGTHIPPFQNSSTESLWKSQAAPPPGSLP